MAGFQLGLMAEMAASTWEVSRALCNGRYHPRSQGNKPYLGNFSLTQTVPNDEETLRERLTLVLIVPEGFFQVRLESLDHRLES